MRTVFLTLTGIALAVVVLAMFVVFSGVYNVAATSQHSSLLNWVLTTTMHQSVKKRASEITVPDLSGDYLLQAGINDFEAMCVACHGAPGKKPEPAGLGLNPQAPDLQQSAQKLSAAEIFWITKHGIRMTGMPAWGKTHGDPDLWPVVALVTRLPELDEDDYAELLSSAAGKGHHAHQDEDAAHEHDDHEAPLSGAGSDAHQHDQVPSETDHDSDPADGHHKH